MRQRRGQSPALRGTDMRGNLCAARAALVRARSFWRPRGLGDTFGRRAGSFGQSACTVNEEDPSSQELEDAMFEVRKSLAKMYQPMRSAADVRRVRVQLAVFPSVCRCLSSL